MRRTAELAQQHPLCRYSTGRGSTEDHPTEPTVSTPFLQNDLLKTKISLLVAVENRTVAVLFGPHDLSLALDLDPETLHFGYLGNFHGDPSRESVSCRESALAVRCVVVQLELFDCHGERIRRAPSRIYNDSHTGPDIESVNVGHVIL